MSSKYFKAEVTSNILLAKNFKLLSLSPLSIIKTPKPGQFYMLQAGNTYDPLLKRPFSIFENEDNTLKFLYRIKGKGTQAISELKKGDVINLIGPLGNSYPDPNGEFIAVAGGIGIASLFLLLKKFKNKAYLFYGSKNKSELLMLDEIRALSKEMYVTTDDGSEGTKGLITEIIKDFLLTTRSSLPVYVCGPTAMIKVLAQIFEDKGIKCFASFEEHMACGVGVCLGCVIKAKEENEEVTGIGWTYKRACKEGPIFDIKEILWE